MKSKHIEFYESLKLINLDTFSSENRGKIETTESIRKNSKFLGSEFDKTFKKLLSQINPHISCNLTDLFIESELMNSQREIIRISLLKNEQPLKKFNLKKFIVEYNFPESNNYQIAENEHKSCKQYLIDLYTKINYNKFIAEKTLITDLNFKHIIRFGNVCNRGIIDLIIDDKLIDIKTDLQINNIPPKYISQLVYYYLFFKYCINSNILKDEYSPLKNVEINKICIFYANFDILIEFDIKKIFPDEKKIMSLFGNELVYGNNKIKEILDKAFLKKSISDEYFIDMELTLLSNRKLNLKKNIEEFFALNDLENVKLLLNELDYEFPNENLSIIFKILLNFSQNEYTLDKSLINENYDLLNDYIIQTINQYKVKKDNVSSGLESYTLRNELYIDIHIDNFKNLIIKSKSYSQFITNLEHFKLYINFITGNIKNKSDVVDL